MTGFIAVRPAAETGNLLRFSLLLRGLFFMRANYEDLDSSSVPDGLPGTC